VKPDPTADYLVEPLADRHNRSQFCSGVAALDRYLRTQAKQDARRRVASPYILLHQPDRVVAGYYTLSNAAVELTDLPESLARRLPLYRQIPVTLLGRLAVDRNHRSRNLGEFLLMDALRRALLGSETVASFAVLVEAKDDSVPFYRKYGFLPILGQPRRLFLPMKTAGKSFAT
jgi:predicted GNAT family N-acyltransferase